LIPKYWERAFSNSSVSLSVLGLLIFDLFFAGLSVFGSFSSSEKELSSE